MVSKVCIPTRERGNENEIDAIVAEIEGDELES
jgi:hypothetical protein